MYIFLVAFASVHEIVRFNPEIHNHMQLHYDFEYSWSFCGLT